MVSNIRHRGYVVRRLTVYNSTIHGSLHPLHFILLGQFLFFFLCSSCWFTILNDDSSCVGGDSVWLNGLLRKLIVA